MCQGDFSKLYTYKADILSESENAHPSYIGILDYVVALKQQGKSTGYLDRFYMYIKSEKPLTFESLKEEKLYFLNIIDEMEIIVSGHFD